jgi:hypothetical protein
MSTVRATAERMTVRVGERGRVLSAFGLQVDLGPGIEVPGLTGSGSGAGGDAGEAGTRVRLDPEELGRRWAPVSAGAMRMRELGDGETTVLSVDLADPAGYLLEAAGVGRVLVSLDGTELLCDPDPDRADWGFILAAQALPLAATLRGFEVLHAAGVVLAGEAVLFAGPPGAGKSSLAAALLRRGGELLSDDAVALEWQGGPIVAHPGAGALYLRTAEQDRLDAGERGRLGSPSPSLSRYRYEPEAKAAAAPLGALFLLERAPQGAAIERLEGGDPFALLAATFNLSVRTPERLIRQLDAVEAIAATERVYRLRVLSGTDATGLARVVEGHLAPAAS